MRIRWVVALLVLCVIPACSGGVGLFKSYEYEEEMYLSLDGAATLYVNSSVPALNALRGTHLDLNPSVRPSRDEVSAIFSSPQAEVTRVTFSKRNNRQFVHVRLDVPDIRTLNRADAFAWSSYAFAREGELFNYRQVVGPPASKGLPGFVWDGGEVIAFRIHLPSKIAYHNAGPGNPQRGNILAWEQPLAGKLKGDPMTLDARVETESILYRTLALFGVTLVVVAVLFVLLLWWVLRRGARPAQV